MIYVCNNHPFWLMYGIGHIADIYLDKVLDCRHEYGDAAICLHAERTDILHHLLKAEAFLEEVAVSVPTRPG